LNGAGNPRNKFEATADACARKNVSACGAGVCNKKVALRLWGRGIEIRFKHPIINMKVTSGFFSLAFGGSHE
jgi:hypothetical protein